MSNLSFQKHPYFFPLSSKFLLFLYTKIMTLEQCKQKLNDAIAQDPRIKESISQLTTQAWGSEKANCYKEFGSL